MKKISIAIVFIAIATMSCSKKRTCTDEYTNQLGLVSTDVRVYDKLTPKEKRDIENMGTFSNDDGSMHKTECK